MTKRAILPFFFTLLAVILAGCHEPHNPLLGSWQHAGPTIDGKTGEIVQFTPSTMIIDGRRVTVVYQIRPDKVRVSASKKAIIYDLIDDDTISYPGPDDVSVRLKRLR